MKEGYQIININNTTYNRIQNIKMTSREQTRNTTRLGLWQTMADYGRAIQTKTENTLINIKTYKGLEEAGKHVINIEELATRDCGDRI